jgi:hypothetical protein
LERDNKRPQVQSNTRGVQIHTDKGEILVQRAPSIFDTRQVEVHTQLVLNCTGRRLEKSVPVKSN